MQNIPVNEKMKKTNGSMFRNWKTYLSLGIISTFLTTIPALAAEELFFIYGALKLPLKVSSLELFANKGQINEDLEFYLKRAKPEQQAKFRTTLTEKTKLDPLLVSRFFNSELGEDMLKEIGQYITIEGGRNGEYAIRGALIQAAADPEGLSLINFFEKLPVNMEFQLGLILESSQAVDKVILATETLIKDMRDLTAQEAATNPPVNFATLPDLRQSGPYGFKKETWQLTDQSRNRPFYVDVYKPQKWREGKTPVLVLSHGLASNPADFAEGGEFMASHGYVVAIPQHPGSDSQHADDLKKGLVKNVFENDSFINRPKDISYVIDELERRNQSEFEGRLNLESVGVGGHSFGGYTALAIAGATLDFEYLQKGCERNYAGLDMALLLQCQALDLPKKSYNFRDERVKAVFAVNPVNRFIFGKQGLNNIKIPILLGSGSYDPATPPALEQIATFIWLTSPDKYWALMEGQAHVNFTKLDGGLQEAIESLNITIPSQSVISNYSNVLSTAFFEVYINQNENYRPYLQSSYAQYLSQDQEFKLNLISGDSSHKVLEAIEKFKKEYGNSENN